MDRTNKCGWAFIQHSCIINLKKHKNEVSSSLESQYIYLFGWKQFISFMGFYFMDFIIHSWNILEIWLHHAKITEWTWFHEYFNGSRSRFNSSNFIVMTPTFYMFHFFVFSYIHWRTRVTNRGCMVDQCSSNISKMWTHMFEWCVVRCGSKNGQWKNMWINKSRLHAQNVLSILGSMVNVNGKITRKIPTNTIWICSSSHTNCAFCIIWW